MTTQTAVIAAASGKTLTGKLFTLADPDTVAYTADSVTERTNAKGEYVATFGEAAAINGDHVLILLEGTRAAARGYRTFTGTDTEVATETPVPVNVTQFNGSSTPVSTLVLFAAALDQATGQIDSGTLAENTLTAAALAADAVAEIQNGLATAAKLLKYVQLLSRSDAFIATDNAAELTEINASGGSGAGDFASTTDALEALRDRGDAAWISGSVSVLPAVGIAADRSAGVTLTPVVGETISQAITVYQSDGTTAVDLSGKTLAIVFETMSGTDVAVVADADITVSGADDNVVTFAYPAAVTASERTLKFALRDAAAPLTMYLQGVCSVTRAPQVDSV